MKSNMPSKYTKQHAKQQAKQHPKQHTYASSFCSDKIFFVLDKTEIVQDENFVQGYKVHFLLSKVI